MTDPAKIAAGLSEAGKNAISESYKRFGPWSVNGPPATLHALKRMGLTFGPFADCLTELGLAVRAHLKGTSDE